MKNIENIIISKVQTEVDLIALSKLYQQANPHATFEEILEWTRDTWKDSNNLLIKADLNNEIVGGISIELLKKKKALIDDIAVKPSLYSIDIGTKLWQYCEKLLKLKGVRIIYGNVHYKRAEIIPFCYKNGFRLNKVVINGFGQGEDYIEVIKYI
jgi:hypothetical protein